MKKIVAIAALLSISSLASAWGAWDRRGPDVAFETRPLGVSRVETVYPSASAPVVVEETEAMAIDRVAPRYYYRSDYRPVSGVVGGAATAAEGVVEGTAQAVSSVVPPL